MDVPAWEKEKRKDDDTSLCQMEERTSGSKSRPRWSVMEEIDKIPEQRHQLLHEEVRNVVPGTVNVVRGGTNIRQVPDLREEQEIYQSATSYEVIDDIDFPFLPQRDGLDAHSIRNTSLQGVEATKQRKTEDQIQTSALSPTNATTEDCLTPNVSMIEPMERKHEASLSAHSVDDYQLPDYVQNYQDQTQTQTQEQGEK